MIVKRIKDIANVRRGASPRPIDDPKYFGGEVGWVRIADVTASGKYLRNTTQYVSPLGESLSVRVNKGDLIISIAGSVGKSIIVDMPACIHDGFVQIYDLKDTETEFLYYYLKFIEKELYRFGQSGTQTNLNRDIVGNIQFTWLPKPEQIHIAEILSSADAAIVNTETLIAKYQHIKTGLMQDLLTKGIDKTGNIPSKSAHKFVVKNGIEVPEEWEVETFKDLCSIIKDGTHLPPKRITDGIWLLGVTNIIDGEWKITKSDTQISEEFYNQMHKNWKIEVGDVLLAIVGATIGKVTQVPGDFPKFTLQRSVCLLRGKENELSNDFLRLFIESVYFQRLLWNEVNVTAQPGIYLDTIGKFQIRKPPFEEQLRIVSRVNSMTHTIDKLKNNLLKLHSLKTGLMQDLLSGKVRVNK